MPMVQLPAHHPSLFVSRVAVAETEPPAAPDPSVSRLYRALSGLSLRRSQRECVPSLIAVDMAPQALHEVAAVLERPLTHLGIIKQTSPYSSFYSLTGTDIDGATVDFSAYRNKVVLLLNVPIGGDWGAEETYKDLRQLLDQFASRPGQPFAVLLLPCDQFQGLRERVGSSLHRLRNLGATSEALQFEAAQAAAQAAAAVRATCATHGLKAPEVRVLAPADVNGPDAHPVWTFLKAAYGDTSDIGWNFGKFVVARNGDVVGRYCPPLRPALLSAAIEKMMGQAPLLQPLLPVGAVAPPKAPRPAASLAAPLPAKTAEKPAETPADSPAITPVAVSCTSVDAANVPITPTASAAVGA